MKRNIRQEVKAIFRLSTTATKTILPLKKAEQWRIRTIVYLDPRRAIDGRIPG